MAVAGTRWKKWLSGFLAVRYACCCRTLPALRTVAFLKCRNIKHIGRQFTFGHQEDSHELYVQMLDAMEAVMLAEAGGKAKFDLRSRVRAPCWLWALEPCP